MIFKPISSLIVSGASALPRASSFTKQEKMFKAKPATTVVKVRPLKGLKDMAV